MVRFFGQLPAPVRHLILVVLATAGTAAWGAILAGKGPAEVVMAAWVAVLAVLTPLIQSYGAGQVSKLTSDHAQVTTPNRDQGPVT
jgi:pheromone shutdown protein TraB